MPPTSAAYFKVPNFGDLVGLPFITVGNNSTADYFSGDQTAFNAAVTSLATTGGTIWVLKGTLIKPTASLLLNVSNIWVIFDKGAKVQLQQGVQFPTAIVSGGSQIWTQVFLTAAPTGSTISNIKVTGLWIDSLNTTSPNKGSVSGFVVGGGVDDLTVYELKTTNIARFGRWAIGYAELVAGTTYSSGNVTNYTCWHHVSDSCGQGGSGGTDGGHAKYSLVPTGGTMKHMHSYDDYATNVFVIGMDFPVVNGDSTQTAVDFKVKNAHMEGSGPNVQIGFFLESADTAGGQGATQRNFVLEGCYASNFAQGYAIDATWENVQYSGCTADSCTLVGLHATATLNAGRTTLNPQNWDIFDFTSRGTPTGISLDSHAVPANTNFDGIVVIGGGTYDDGTATVTTGIALRSAATKGMTGVYIGWYNLAHINAGTAVDTSAVTSAAMSDVLIENCEGFAGLAYSLSTAFSRWANILTVIGAAIVGGTLSVTGAATLLSTLGVTGATTLSSTLHLVGAGTFDSTLGVTGALTASSTFHAVGAVTHDSTLTQTGTAAFSAALTKINGRTTAGSNGVPAVIGKTFQRAETVGDANLLTATPPASAGLYRIHILLDVATITSAPNISFTVDYTDSQGFHQVAQLLPFTRLGNAAQVTAVALAVHGVYEVSFPISIDNGAHNIVLAIVLNSGTSYTGDCSAWIESVTDS